MTTAGVGLVRAARAAVALLAVLGISTAAHEVGGGRAPGVVALAFLALLVGPPVWVATGRRLTTPALVALLGGAQVVVHLVLRTMVPGHGSGAALHVHGGVPGALVPGAAPAMPEMASLDAPMLLAHVAATLVLSVVLARAEAALWHVVSALLPRPVPTLRWPLVPRFAVAVVAPRPAGRAPRPVGGRAPPVVPA